MSAAVKPRTLKLQEFVAHGANVNCLALGRKSGQVLVTGGDDKKVNLWAVGKANCIMSLSGHTTPVECVRFGHSEELVCAGSLSGALKIWDLEAAKIIRTLTGHKANSRSVDFHPYGDFLASGSVDTNIKLWDIRRKGCIFTYKGHTNIVNSVKFSPDGKWIASAGEDGIVKLWDLPAGKMLAEFSGHMASVTDVEFHPNEFLLASCSLDRTISFWDLENFQQVSTTDGESGAIRCIYFNPDGECLYSGALDSLKVYGWEPSRTYDNIPMSWGKVSSLATAQDQLIGASFHMMNVSIYIIDVKRIQPFADSNLNTPFQQGTHLRKSFIRSKQSALSAKNAPAKCSAEDADSPTPDIDPGDDSISTADIKNPDDYKSIFHSRGRELTRTPPLPTMLMNHPIPARFPPPRLPQGVSRPEAEAQPKRPIVMTAAAAKVTEVVHKATVMAPTQMDQTPYQAELYQPQDIYHAPYMATYRLAPEPPYVAPKVERGTRNVQVPIPAARLVSKKVDVVSAATTKTNKVSSTRIELDEGVVGKSGDEKTVMDRERVDIVPMQRECSVGLDVDEFLPQSMRRFHELNIGVQQQPEMSEAEAISSIVKGHHSMVAVMTNRLRNVQIIQSILASKDLKSAMDAAVNMNDLSVMVDILSVISMRSAIWTLDLSVILLPVVHELVQTKYESYMAVGCESLKVVLKNFGPLIRDNRAPPSGIGIDISREERYNKCKSCYNHLVSIRAFVLKRQTLQGKLGQTFRELQIMLQELD